MSKSMDHEIEAMADRLTRMKVGEERTLDCGGVVALGEFNGMFTFDVTYGDGVTAQYDFPGSQVKEMRAAQIAMRSGMVA